MNKKKSLYVRVGCLKACLWKFLPSLQRKKWNLKVCLAMSANYLVYKAHFHRFYTGRSQ